jgi:beta-glucanase (GH16 family)
MDSTLLRRQIVKRRIALLRGVVVVGLLAGLTIAAWRTSPGEPSTNCQAVNDTITASTTTAQQIPTPRLIAGQGYKLAFHDEFETLDANLTRRRDDAHFWQNAWYSPALPAGAAFASGGILHLESKRADGYPDVTLSTRRATLAGSSAWKYGYLEARMNVPAGDGAWPAFWMSALQHAFTGTVPPQNGEIDAFEGQGAEPTVYYGTVHKNTGGARTADQTNANSARDTGIDLCGSWHTYAILWTPTTVSWYLDDTPLMSAPTYAADPTWGVSTDQRMVIYLQMATGGWTVPTDSTTPDTLDLQVDWVRGWQAA